MPSDLGLAIRAAREKKGLGLREFARRIGKSPAYVVQLELADAVPGVTEATLESVAAELSLESDALMALAAKAPLNTQPRTPLEIGLYRLVRRLPLDRQKALLESLEAELGEKREAMGGSSNEG